MKKNKPSGKGLFRDGGKLVIREGARFPDRCVICDKPCDGETVDFVFQRRKSHYIDVAAVQTVANAAADLIKGARYTGPVHAAIPLCSWHRNRRLRIVGYCAGVMALAAAYLASRYYLGVARDFDTPQLPILSAVAFLTGITGLGIGLAAVYDPTELWFRISKFNDRLVWVQGAGGNFLDALPRFEGQHQRGSSRGRYTPDEDEGNISAEELIRRAGLEDDK
jgi:hypothetical protein